MKNMLETTKNNNNYSIHARKFVDNIENMKSPHKNEIDCSERFGSIEDYSVYQEQKDLKNYKTYLNSSAYDFEREAEERMHSSKQLSLSYLRRIGGEHD